jgi:hypothetical protein
VVVGLAGHAHGRSRAGEDQAVAVQVEPAARGRAGGEAPAAAGEVDAVHLGQDRLGRDLRGDPAQILAPLAVGGQRPPPVDPVGEALLVDKVALP